jgi:hypothetical protein
MTNDKAPLVGHTYKWTGLPTDQRRANPGSCHFPAIYLMLAAANRITPAEISEVESGAACSSVSTSLRATAGAR